MLHADYNLFGSVLLQIVVRSVIKDFLFLVLHALQHKVSVQSGFVLLCACDCGISAQILKTLNGQV